MAKLLPQETYSRLPLDLLVTLASDLRGEDQAYGGNYWLERQGIAGGYAIILIDGGGTQYEVLPAVAAKVLASVAAEWAGHAKMLAEAQKEFQAHLGGGLGPLFDDAGPDAAGEAAAEREAERQMDESYERAQGFY